MAALTSVPFVRHLRQQASIAPHKPHIDVAAKCVRKMQKSGDGGESELDQQLAPGVRVFKVPPALTGFPAWRRNKDLSRSGGLTRARRRGASTRELAFHEVLLARPPPIKLCFAARPCGGLFPIVKPDPKPPPKAMDSRLGRIPLRSAGCVVFRRYCSQDADPDERVCSMGQTSQAGSPTLPSMAPGGGTGGAGQVLRGQRGATRLAPHDVLDLGRDSHDLGCSTIWPSGNTWSISPKLGGIQASCGREQVPPCLGPV